MVASDSSYPFSKLPATNGGSSSNTFCIPSVRVVLFNQARHPHGLYSAVETGMTFFSLPSFIFTFLPPSLENPGTSAGAGGGKLNVYDAIRSSVVHAATFRAFLPSRPVAGSVLGVCDLPPTSEILSSSYWAIQWTTAPISKPASHESAGPSQNRLKLARFRGSELVRLNADGKKSPAILNRFVSGIVWRL